MSKALRTVLVGMAAFFVGGLLFVGQAGAVTLKTPALSLATSPAGPKIIEWFLGEDNALWYTVIDDGGLVVAATTPILGDGNLGGVFNQAAATGNGTSFVNPTGLNAACISIGTAQCPGTSSIYSKVPSVGLFIDGPVAFDYGANAGAGLGGIDPDMDRYIMVQLPGQDNGLWYLLYDRFDLGFVAGSFGVNNVNEPYVGVTENADSGFALATGAAGNLLGRCAAVTPARTCVGVFVRKPQ